MAINFNNQNQNGIGNLDLSQFGLMQPQNTNMQTAGFLPQFMGGTSDEEDAAQNSLQQIQDLRKNQMKGIPQGNTEAETQSIINDLQYTNPTKLEQYQSIEKQIQDIKNQNKNSQQFKDIGGQTAGLTGPFFGVEAFLNGSGMNPNEDQEFLQNINPQPINPLNRNQFDPNAFNLQTQVNNDTFSPRPGTSLQDMLTQRELQANPGEPNFINEPQDFYPQSGQVGNFINAPQDFYKENPIENLGFIDPSTVPTEAIYDESMANALPGYNYNRFPNFNKNPTRFQNFKDGFGDIKDNFQDGFENFQDTVGDGFENVQDKFGDGFENVQDIIGTGVDKFKSGLGSIKDFAINKGNMGKNLLGSAGAMAMGLPGIVGSGLMSLLSNLGNGVDYQQYTPGQNYNGLNDSMINDFYDPRTKTNRFQRAKPGSFASFRTGADYFKARREKKAAAEAAAQAAAERASYMARAQTNADRRNNDGSGNTTNVTGFGKSGLGRDPDDKMANGGRVGLASMFTRRR